MPPSPAASPIHFRRLSLFRSAVWRASRASPRSCARRSDTKAGRGSTGAKAACTRRASPRSAVSAPRSSSGFLAINSSVRSTPSLSPSAWAFNSSTNSVSFIQPPFGLHASTRVSVSRSDADEAYSHLQHHLTPSDRIPDHSHRPRPQLDRDGDGKGLNQHLFLQVEGLAGQVRQRLGFLRRSGMHHRYHRGLVADLGPGQFDDALKGFGADADSVLGRQENP